MAKVLLINDDPYEITSLEMHLMTVAADHHFTVLTDPIEAMMRLRKTEFDIMFVNYRMSVIDGLSLVRIANQISDSMYINVIASQADAVYIKTQPTYKACNNLMLKPCDVHDVKHVFEQFLQWRQLKEENKKLSQRLSALEKYSRLDIQQVASR